MLLRSVIGALNEKLKEVIPGLNAFGLAQTVVRTRGNEEERLPVQVNLKGEGVYVGLDDKDKVRLYHRLSDVTTSVITQGATGDDVGLIQNVYRIAMIVYCNNNRIKIFPEELFLYIQSSLNEMVKPFDPYRLISIRTINVIFNSQLVFTAEYSGAAFKLPPESSLFQINYVIESRHKKNCFAKCPEDC